MHMAKKNSNIRENPSNYFFLHHKSHTDTPEIEAGPWLRRIESYSLV